MIFHFKKRVKNDLTKGKGTFLAQSLDSKKNIHLKISDQQGTNFFFWEMVLGVKFWVWKYDKETFWQIDISQCYQGMQLVRKLLRKVMGWGERRLLFC